MQAETKYIRQVGRCRCQAGAEITTQAGEKEESRHAARENRMIVDTVAKKDSYGRRGADSQTAAGNPPACENREEVQKAATECLQPRALRTSA